MSTILFGPDFDFEAILRDKANVFVIITDSHVKPLIAEPLRDMLHNCGFNVKLISFTAGEKQKSRATKEWIEDQMFSQKWGRDTCILAVGGGVVTDLAGFIASTYCRGIPYFSFPTTLVGMIDAAIGGKTGVNISYGKNLIGTFYRPEAIFINPEYVLTLPEKEMRNGIAEIIKHALIADRSLFEDMETSLKAWQERELSFIEKMIRRNCSIKEAIVNEDPFEKGVRRILNFGHSIGHAIEAADLYEITHGEAIAMGMFFESTLSLNMGILSQEDWQRIRNLLILYGFSLRLPRRISLKALKSALSLDKKSLLSLPRYVVLKAIGKPESFNGAFCTLLKEEQVDALPLH